MDFRLERQFKNQIYERLAEVCKAFANPRRLEILEILAQGERSVEDLAREINVSVASASQHLQQLRAARLVSVRRSGVKANYRLADEEVLCTLRAIISLGQTRLAEIDRLIEDYLPQRQQYGTVTVTELRAALQSEDLVILDVRPVEEYQAGHIPGAISIPGTELHNHLDEIQSGRKIVVYCRSQYSTLSDQAVTILREYGYIAHRLHTGFPDWKSCGFPIEQPASETAQVVISTDG